MPHPYKWLLLAITIAVPFAIVAYRNNFDRGWVTLTRSVVAVAAVWLIILGTRGLVDYVDVRLAVTQAELDLISNCDGARNTFALLLGWVPGVILAAMSWALARAIRWAGERRSPSNSRSSGRSPGVS
jgi:hypothetical protein